MSSPLQFSVQFGGGNAPKKKNPSEPLRILYLADLGDGASRPRPLSERPIREVDIDSFEAFLAAEAPALRLGGDGEADGPVEMRFRDSEDFHPDQIFRSLPVFQELKGLRQRLRNQPSFEAAAADLRARLQAVPELPDQAAPTVPSESNDDTMERLFGKRDDRPGVPAGPDGTSPFLNRLIHDVVAAHVVAAPDPRQDLYVEAIDAAISAQMRAILHDPDFQALEAAWRGLEFMVSNIETDEEVRIFAWNASADELRGAIGPDGRLSAESLLYRKLIEQREDAPFGLLVSPVAFRPDDADVQLLEALGQITAQSDALLLASTAPEMLGHSGWSELVANPGGAVERPAGWATLRASAVADRISLVAPGFLLRLPYGRMLDAIDAFAFEELEDPGAADAGYLWGSGAVLASVLVAGSFRRDQWSLHLGGNLEVGDLPSVTYSTDGETHLRPCAEHLLTERAAEAVMLAGVTPLLGFKNRNAVRLPGFQSIAEGAASRVGPFRV